MIVAFVWKTNLQQNAKDLKEKMLSQQNMLTKATTKNNLAVKASFAVAEEIPHVSMSFSEQVCPDQIKKMSVYQQPT